VAQDELLLCSFNQVQVTVAPQLEWLLLHQEAQSLDVKNRESLGQPGTGREYGIPGRTGQRAGLNSACNLPFILWPLSHMGAGQTPAQGGRAVLELELPIDRLQFESYQIKYV
jgi:hypothetical protein